jgi:predicted ArsR family transcriptional regulator
MAEVVAQADGTFLLVEKHCPICAVASACTGMCQMELEVFQATLGKDVTIERIEHIVDNDPEQDNFASRRCVCLVR